MTHPAIHASAFANPLLAVAILAYAIGIWVVIQERGRPVSRLLLAIMLALGTYQLGFSFALRAADGDTALRWIRVAYLGVPFIVPGLYHFSVDLLGLTERRRWVVRAAWAVGAVYCVLAVATDILVPGVLLTGWGYYSELTPWNLPFMAVSLLLIALIGRDFVAEYQGADTVQKARIRWFAIPVAVASLGFMDYLPSLGIGTPPVGVVVFPVFLLAAAWAVGRYHLPDLTPAIAADQIVATVADPLVVCRSDGRIAVVNPATCRLADRPEDELLGAPLSLLFGPDDVEWILGPVGTSQEMAMLARDGPAVAVAVSTAPLLDRGGRALGTVVVARDIRDRKRAADELRRSEERFRALIEHAHDTITLLDPDGTVLYQSPAVGVALGIPVKEYLGRNVFDQVHPDDVAPIQAAFRELVASPGSTTRVEGRLRHRDGSYRRFELQGTNLLKHPAVGAIVVNGRDVTRARHLEEELQQAQKLEAIGRLAGGVAHDFNNVLTSIQGNVAFIQEHLPPDSPAAEEIAEVRRGAERAARLTDQLLAFGRRKLIRPRILDVNEVVQGARGMLERIVGADARLGIRLGDGPLSAEADRDQIEQVILNLVLNARDAMGRGGRIEISTGTVDLDDVAVAALDHAVPPGRYVRLSVADEGVGMDSATLSRVFEPFFTTKGEARGAGLGLSTVYGAVRQAGGYVGATSEPGDGTTFNVYLPWAEAPADGPEGSPSGTLETATATGETVLIVEDEAPVRSLMARVLTRRGYHVLEAEDGEAALRVAADHPAPIHLLVADLVMPGLNGREVAERLGQERSELQTIFVSGYTADDAIREGIETGRHIFLPKPFTPDRLAALVRQVLDGRVPAG